MDHLENMDSYISSHFNTEAECFVSHHDSDIQYHHTVESPVCTFDFLIGFSECKLAWKNVLEEPLNYLRSALTSNRHKVFRILLSLLRDITTAIKGLITTNATKQHHNCGNSLSKSLLIEQDDVRIKDPLPVEVSHYANMWSSSEDSDDDAESFHSMSDCDESSSQDDTDSECFMDRYDSTSEASEAGFHYDNVEEDNGVNSRTKSGISGGISSMHSLFVHSGMWLPLSRRRSVSTGDLNKLSLMNAICEQISSAKTCPCHAVNGMIQLSKMPTCDVLQTCLGRVHDEHSRQTECNNMIKCDSEHICIEPNAVDTIKQHTFESPNSVVEDMNSDSIQTIKDNDIKMSHDVSYQDLADDKTIVDCTDNENYSSEHMLPRQVKIFPPPLSIRASETHPEFPGCVSRTFWKSVKKDGRFVLQEVQAQPQGCFLARRDNGRLLLQLVRSD